MIKVDGAQGLYKQIYEKRRRSAREGGGEGRSRKDEGITDEREKSVGARAAFRDGRPKGEGRTGKKRDPDSDTYHDASTSVVPNR